jgi:fucose permease
VRTTEAAAFGGMFLFGIVIALLGAVLPLVSAPLGLDLGDVGNLFLVLNGAMLAGSLALGLALDRFGFRGVLAGGPLLIATALVLVARAGEPATLTGAVAVLGLGGAALNNATNTLVAELHEDPRAKSAALNRLGVFFGFGALFLPFLIGAMVETLGLAALLVATAALCLLVSFFSVSLRYPPAKQQSLSVGAALAVLRHPLVPVLGVLLLFQSGNEFLLGGYLTTFLTEETGATVRAASWVLAGYWAALMVARMLLGRALVRVSSARLVPVMAGGAAAALLAAALAPGFPTAAAALLAAAFALAGIFPTVLGLAGAQLEGRTGTVFGVLFTFALTGAMTIPWVAGHVAASAGVRAVLFLGASLFVAVTLLAMRAAWLSRVSAFGPRVEPRLLRRPR